MKRFAWTLSVLVAGAAMAVAQPPDGPRGSGRGGDFRPPPNPLVDALDTDGDGVISADELKNATESLTKLDTNKDGKLADDEIRPKPPIGDRGAGAPGGNRGRGVEGRGTEGRGPAGRGGDARGPEGRAGQGREAGGPGGRGPEGRGDGARGPEGPGGPPTPDRFIEHAMEFDADKDGKLNRDELAKFAQEMIQRRGGGPGGPPDGRPGGPGNADGRSESSERPRRPD